MKEFPSLQGISKYENVYLYNKVDLIVLNMIQSDMT